MYGSYGSYSSMSAASINISISAPMEIPGSNSSQGASCAFPSWPRRSSLDTEDQERPTSFLSDDDLGFFSDPFTDDDAHSISSASSNATSPAQQQVTDAQLFDMERQRLAMQREYVRQVVSEKERRRQQQAKRAQASRRSHSSKKSSPKSKLSAMTPITEATS